MATYYAQRASAGLIVTEGTQPSAVGQGYPNTPGLHAPEHVTGWRRVTDAVHESGGVIFVQLMHSGRISHSSLLPDGVAPVGPSAVAAQGSVFTTAGMRPLEVPRELTGGEIEATIQDFADAAENAVRAGFDGVEVHAGNGYLLHQFLATNANLRADRWGGPADGRIRLPVEVTQAVARRIGAGRVGFRISPNNPYNDIREERYQETYAELVDALSPPRDRLPPRGGVRRSRSHGPAATPLEGRTDTQPRQRRADQGPGRAGADRRWRRRHGLVRGPFSRQP